MKNKNLFSLVIKIMGLVALWKAIVSFGLVITGIGILFTVNSHGFGSFMLVIALNMILSFLMPLFIAYFFLLKTDKVVSKIKINEESKIDLNLKKGVMYHIMVLSFGFMFILYGSSCFLSFDYKTDTKTTHVQNKKYDEGKKEHNVDGSDTITTTNSKNKKVNYFALIEIIMGIVLLTKATDISRKVERNFDSKNEESYNI
jgi:hypothetical protein